MTKVASAINESAILLAKAMARKCFDEVLAQCEFGLTCIYSTQPDHAATDIRSFTRCMISGVKDILLSNSDRQVINLKEATVLAIEILKNYHIQQIPVYNAGRRRNHFPFAVNSMIAEK
jgi:hypothetical protein